MLPDKQEAMIEQLSQADQHQPEISFTPSAGRIPSPIITALVSALHEFGTVCERFGVTRDHIVAFATEAMRKAANREELLEAILSGAGLRVRVLTPHMEGLLGALGARSRFGLHGATGLYSDLGGGSVQMTWLNGHRYNEAAVDGDGRGSTVLSAPFGAAKVTSQWQQARDTEEELIGTLQQHATDLGLDFPISERMEKEEKRVEIPSTASHGRRQSLPRHTLADGQQDREDDRAVTLYLYGGGWRGYGYMLMAMDPVQPYPLANVDGYTVSGEIFSNWEAAKRMNASEGKLQGLSKRRRKQFEAILLVVRAVIQSFQKIDQVVFCGTGNREGLLFSLLPWTMQQTHPSMSLLFADSDAQAIAKMAEMVKCNIPIDAKHNFKDEILRLAISSAWSGTSLGEVEEQGRSWLSDDDAANSVGSHLDRICLAIIEWTRTIAQHHNMDKKDTKLLSKLHTIAGEQTAWHARFIGVLLQLLVRLAGAPDITSAVNRLCNAIPVTVSVPSPIDDQHLPEQSPVDVIISLREEQRNLITKEEAEAMFRNVETWPGRLTNLDYRRAIRINIKVG